MSINFTPQIIAADAPFNDAQRAWLNRYFAEALLKACPRPAYQRILLLRLGRSPRVERPGGDRGPHVVCD